MDSCDWMGLGRTGSSTATLSAGDAASGSHCRIVPIHGLLIDDVPVSRKIPDQTCPFFRIVQRTALTWDSRVVNCKRASSSSPEGDDRQRRVSPDAQCTSTRPGIVLRPMRRSRRKRRIAPGSDHHLPKVILVTTQIGSSGEVESAATSPTTALPRVEDDRDRDQSEERVGREPHRPGCAQEAQPWRPVGGRGVQRLRDDCGRKRDAEPKAVESEDEWSEKGRDEGRDEEHHEPVERTEANGREPEAEVESPERPSSPRPALAIPRRGGLPAKGRRSQAEEPQVGQQQHAPGGADHDRQHALARREPGQQPPSRPINDPVIAAPATAPSPKTVTDPTEPRS